MREPQLGVAVGKKGVGKTFETTNVIKAYVSGNPACGIAPRRVLILDVNDEFEGVRALSLKDVSAFSAHPKVEARRIRPFNPDGRKMTLDDLATTLFVILDKFRGGLLLIEDVNKYIGDNMPNDLIGAICTNRHANLDIILHYQSIGRINPKVWQNVNFIRFHKNTDSVDRHRNKFEDKYDYLKLTEILVNNEYQTNPRFFCYVNIDEEKIRGNFTISAIEKGLNDYIEQNYGLVKKLLQVKSTSGSGNKYTPLSAEKHIKDFMKNTYLK